MMNSLSRVKLTPEAEKRINYGLERGWSIRQVAIFAGVGIDWLLYSLKDGAIAKPEALVFHDEFINSWQHFQTRQTRLFQNVRNHLVELPTDYLFFLYLQQEGKCFYTGKMLPQISNRADGLSVDRVDTGLGYVDGNVVLTSARINSVKSDCSFEEIRKWMPQWWHKIDTKLPKLNTELHQLLICYMGALESPIVRSRIIACESLEYGIEKATLFEKYRLASIL